MTDHEHHDPRIRRPLEHAGSYHAPHTDKLLGHLRHYYGANPDGLDAMHRFDLSHDIAVADDDLERPPLLERISVRGWLTIAAALVLAAFLCGLYAAALWRHTGPTWLVTGLWASSVAAGVIAMTTGHRRLEDALVAFTVLAFAAALAATLVLGLTA